VIALVVTLLSLAYLAIAGAVAGYYAHRIDASYGDDAFFFGALWPITVPVTAAKAAMRRILSDRDEQAELKAKESAELRRRLEELEKELAAQPSAKKS
jgi:hypothetical protein